MKLLWARAITIAIIVSFVLPLPILAQDIIQEGDFEACTGSGDPPPSPWIVRDVTCSTFSYGGTWSAELWEVPDFMRQEVSLPGPGVLNVSGYSSRHDTTGASFRVALKASGGGGADLDSCSFSTPIPMYTFEPFSCDLDVPTGGSYSVGIYYTAGPGEVWIDNVTGEFTSDETPTPTATSAPSATATPVSGSWSITIDAEQPFSIASVIVSVFWPWLALLLGIILGYAVIRKVSAAFREGRR